MPLPLDHEQLSYKDYLNWDEHDRAELINGAVVMMAPPSRKHQQISMEISRQLANYLEGKKCKVYAAPFAVRLFETHEDKPEDVDTVVEPDITVVCDHTKLDDRGCKGAPDFIIEILSPSTARHDRLVKLGLYKKAGVKEYWIVSPEEKNVQVYLLDGANTFPHEIYGPDDVAKVNTLPGCFIELSSVFSE